MAVGCQTSKCGARCRLIGGKLRDPGTKAPKDRYRFTPASLGFARYRMRTVQFRFSTLDPARERKKKRTRGRARKPLCFVLSSPALLDDRGERSGHTYGGSEVRNRLSTQLVADVYPGKYYFSTVCAIFILYEPLRIFKPCLP